MKTKIKSKLVTAEELEKIISRLSNEILNSNQNIANTVIIGMQTRGVHLANRIADNLFKSRGEQSQTGELDVSFYRDDFRTRLKQPVVQVTDIPFSIDEKKVILVDDVLYTGRTIRSAMNALMDHGRPASVQLAVLVDRGHRELPIQPDYVGKEFTTLQNEEVRVKVNEEDGEDAVYVVELIED